MAKTKQRSVRLIRGVALVLGLVLALVLVPSTAKAATTTYTTASSDGSLSTYSNISQALSVAKQTGRPIAIDPGHGGWDSGASANGMKEADLTWKIAQACKDYLESCGVTVYLTRGQDEYVSVYDRVERAVENNCCAIVSIHINAGGGRGAEVESTNSSSYNQDLYYAGQSLSALVLSGLQSTGLTVHGAGIITRDYPSGQNSSLYEDGSVADYYGITRYARKAGILGVIIEHGFIDGTSDAAKLSNSNYLTSFGRADGAAIYNQFYSSDTWWSASGINVSTTEAYVGEAVTYSPKIMGVGENLTYNYVWAKPDWSSWGSTVKSTGSMTTSASGTFTPTEAGTYRLFIDVCSNGTSKTTRMVTITVKNGYGYRGVKVTTDMPVAGDAVTFSANVVGQVSGLKYNYVWSYEGSWALDGLRHQRDLRLVHARQGGHLHALRGRREPRRHEGDQVHHRRGEGRPCLQRSHRHHRIAHCRQPCDLLGKRFGRYRRPHVQLRLAARRLLGQGRVGLHGPLDGLRHQRDLRLVHARPPARSRPPRRAPTRSTWTS